MKEKWFGTTWSFDFRRLPLLANFMRLGRDEKEKMFWETLWKLQSTRQTPASYLFPQGGSYSGTHRKMQQERLKSLAGPRPPERSRPTIQAPHSCHPDFEQAPQSHPALPGIALVRENLAVFEIPKCLFSHLVTQQMGKTGRAGRSISQYKGRNWGSEGLRS